MPVKKYNPTSPARRDMSVLTFDEITKTEPEKSLLQPLKKMRVETHMVGLLFATRVEEQNKI